MDIAANHSDVRHRILHESTVMTDDKFEEFDEYNSPERDDDYNVWEENQIAQDNEGYDPYDEDAAIESSYLPEDCE